ncbi:caspase family protein [Almyronema epifaneia]|uniref:Caspase family protein n=1 Tax=Almyronema epifaneia S1 TaxID=2991925 RepID=A0ABW6ICN7_9CYAN
MNIAIVLAVSEYQGTSCLPGCVLDGQLMKSLLDATGKYNEILLINQETFSIKVKDKLSDFISKNQGEVFDEVFFYYTGHGDFRENEFYYILTDFDRSNYRQTTLANSELDNFLRQLNPELIVKVIDACHSGVTYIKDNDVFSKHIIETKQQFKHCYFMFSSMNNQSSYQSNVISHFTKSFIDAVASYPSTEIRYKHIIDSISDDFDTNALQKPLFVTQAGFTEVFCSVNQKMKDLLLGQMGSLLESKSEDDGLKILTLVELIKQDSQKYCSREEALKTLESIEASVRSYIYSPEISDLYDIQIEFESDNKSISEHDDSIGKWLKENNNDYFSKVTYRREAASGSSPIIQAMASLSYLYGDDKVKYVISGFELTVDVPFKLIKIDAHPKYPNLDWQECKIAFVFSQVNIRFFYFYSNFKLSTWDQYTHNFSSDWQTIEVEMKDSERVEGAISGILSKFDSFVLDPLRAKYILTVDSRSS